ncbi:MAG: serine hydrolase [Bacteroidetes bacterium]|nr:serine hydrolase [Bacteroidota bacterium]
MLRHLKSFLFVFVLLSFFLFSCGGEEEVSVTATPEDLTGTVWADSILGGLTEQQKYFQHLIIEVPANYQFALDSLSQWIIANQPGALYFSGWDADSVQRIKECLDTHNLVQPFFFANYFELVGAVPYPFWQVNKQNRNPGFTDFFDKAGYHLLNFELTVDPDKSNQIWLDTISKKQGLIPIVATYSDNHAAEQFDDFITTLKSTHHGVLVNLNRYDTVNFESYRMANDYNGLFFVKSKEQAINELLKHGADFVFRRLEAAETFSAWKPAEEDLVVFNESTRRILIRKALRNPHPVKVNAAPELSYIRLNMQVKSTALIRNEKKLVPFKSKFTVYGESEVHLTQKVRSDCGVSYVGRKLDVLAIDEISGAKGNKVVLLNDTCSAEVLEKIAAVKADKNVVVAFSNPAHFESLSACPHLVYYPSLTDFNGDLFVQQLCSRLPLSADFAAPDSLIRGIFTEKKVLAHTDPEFCGLDKDTLSAISGLMNNCMSNHAFPGGQVVIAKDGCIIYDRVFGKYTYAGQTLVSENSMYDLASLTKIVSTTLVGMKLYEMGLYEMDDSLNQYLPDSLRQHLPYPSTIRNITFQELFTHTSGLPAGFPIIKYMRYTSPEVGRYDRFFCDRPDSVYNTEVAEGFYLERDQQDSMWLRLNQIYLDPSKPYKYSDVNMNTLYFMFKSFIEKSPEKFGFTQSRKQLKDKNLYEEFLYNTFYKPLGMNHTRFRPLNYFSRDLIVPTENETYWRKQLLHGHVHDPNAALHGGIAGNAGIFSTAGDLVILCQMWLNKGVYNGQRYLKAETIEKFTARQQNCFRGLGFNKPSMGSTSFGMSENASLGTYGHTGFTGTCLWVDPEHNLIYIYLSNAVHPDVNNKTYEYGIRKKVHQCAYDAMMREDF